MRRAFLFVAMVKSRINFSASYEKGYGEFFISARMVDIVVNMVLSGSLSGNNPRTYRCYIRMAEFLIQRLNIFNIFENVVSKVTGSRTVGISNHI